MAFGFTTSTREKGVAQSGSAMPTSTRSIPGAQRTGEENVDRTEPERASRIKAPSLRPSGEPRYSCFAAIALARPRINRNVSLHGCGSSRIRSWASAVTTAVAPLCWESKTFLTTVSGSDTITQLPHQGYLIRTQPNTHLQIGKLGEFLLSLKVKRVFVLAAQTPFALPSQKRLGEVLSAGGSELVGGVVYDKDKATFRSEIDQALKTRPDMVYMNGYTPDVTVVMKELYKAGYTGAKVAQGYAVNQKLLDSLPAEVTDGTYT